MATQQQDRFWEVMDQHGQKHGVCAAYYIVTGDGGLVFHASTGEACPDEGLAPSRVVASFAGYVYVKDIPCPTQAGEDARESDNLEDQVAAATAELAQEARPCPGLSPYEAIMGFAGWLTSRDEAVTFSARHDAARAAELVDLFCRTNQIDQEPSEHWPNNLRHPKEAEAKGNPGDPAPDARASAAACGCGDGPEERCTTCFRRRDIGGRFASIEARLSRAEADQAKHRVWFAQLLKAGYLFGPSQAELAPHQRETKDAAPSPCECRDALTACEWCQSLELLDRVKSDLRLQKAVDAQVAEAERRAGAHQVTGRRAYAEMAAPPRRSGFFRFLPGWVYRDYGRGDA